MQKDYFNQNYDYYWLSIAKLGQSLVLICCGFIVVVISNIVIWILSKIVNKESNFGKQINYYLAQYKFNAYIRYYMLCYFDLTFFSVMKLVDGNDST